MTSDPTIPVPKTITPNNGNDDNIVKQDIGGVGTSSLPEVPPVHDEQNNNNASRNRIIVAVLLGLLVICAIVLGLVLPEGKSKKGDNIMEFPETPTLSPTTIVPPPPTLAPTTSPIATASSPVTGPVPVVAGLDQVKQFLINQDISSQIDLDTVGSPQYRAANWIAYDDDFNITVPTLSSIADDGNGWKEFVVNDAYHFILRYVLALLYFQTSAGGSNDWINTGNFATSKPICEWSTSSFLSGTVGVSCDEELGVPNVIKLDFNNLQGSLPTELGKLWSIRAIDVEYNLLTGTLPTEMAQMPVLRSLFLQKNNFQGPIPDGLGSNGVFRSIIASNNNMTGTIPASFKLSKTWRNIALDDNLFTGNIYDILDNDMINLTLVFLEDNMFTGTLSDNFLKSDNHNFTRLHTIDISNNLLNGTIPSHLFTLNKLKVIDFHGNQISGNLPEFPLNNGPFDYLALHKNKINGPIPSSIINLTALYHLDLSNNQLSGPMITDIGSMNGLRYLFLSENNFTQGIIPNEYSGLNNLKELSLKSTNRIGPISDFFETFVNIQLLDLDNNGLSGPIPSFIGNLTRLFALLLNRNELTGVVPSNELSNLDKLRLLFLDKNSLSGTLEPVCNLTSFLDKSFGYPIIADCDEVNCTCCTVCCQDTVPLCNDNTFVPSSDPIWEANYVRTGFVFGDETNFGN